MKKRLAIFMHGGIAGGLFNQGFPPIVGIVNRLSEEYNVWVYAHAPDRPEPGVKFRFETAPVWLTSGLLRWIVLVLKFVGHTIKNRYDNSLAFWGYPTGVVSMVAAGLVGVRSTVILLGGETANIPEIKYGHLRNTISRKLILWMAKRVTNLITVSERQKKVLVDNGVTRNIKVIPWGSDVNVFFANEKRKTTELRILHVANLTEVKDQEMLIKAFDLIADKIPARLKIVGGDYMQGKIHEAAKKLQHSAAIEFIGAVRHREIVSYYQWADLFMLTSLSEGQNSSLHEAMSCGCIPASTDVGAMDKLVGEEIGIVVNCGDYEMLACRVIDLYNDKAMWNAKQAQAVKYAITHDFENTIRQIKTVLEHA